MAAEIKRACGIEALLEESHGGIFEVSLNDTVIYTNKGANRREYSLDYIILTISEAVT